MQPQPTKLIAPPPPLGSRESKHKVKQSKAKPTTPPPTRTPNTYPPTHYKYLLFTIHRTRTHARSSCISLFRSLRLLLLDSTVELWRRFRLQLVIELGEAIDTVAALMVAVHLGGASAALG